MYFRTFWFLANYLLSFIGTVLLMTLLEFVPGLQPSLAPLLVLPLLISSTIEGQHYAQIHHTRPSPRKCWIAALKMTVLVVISVCVTLPFVLWWQGNLAWIGPSALILVAVALLLLRIGYAIGLASELKGRQV